MPLGDVLTFRVVGGEGGEALRLTFLERGRGGIFSHTPEPHIVFCPIFVHPLFPVFELHILKNGSFLYVIAFLTLAGNVQQKGLLKVQRWVFQGVSVFGVYGV